MDRTIQFLKTRFSNYYQNKTTAPALSFPERFTRREWGFMFLGQNFMQRHIAFQKSAEIKRFLSGKKGNNNKPSGHQAPRASQDLVPAHVYYSIAYYKEPSLQPMPSNVEGRLVADLIFDLDDDHLRNIEGLSYEERLKKVKDIVRFKLLDDFILSDFGFDLKYIHIAFSGSRGYHIHVRDPSVLGLNSAQRREIVDYLIGMGLNLDRIFPMEVYDSKEYGNKKYSKKPKVVTPKLDSAGWKGRMARGIFELINKLSKLPEEDAIEVLGSLCKERRLKGRKIKDEEVEAIYRELFHRSGVKYTKETFEQRNVLEIFSKDSLRDIFLDIVREHQKVEMAGETDEPVTTDVKRLIRMPTSLHGKTGFRVVPLEIDELKSFDPFSNALAFGSEPVKIKIIAKEPVKFRLGTKHFNMKPGVFEVPEFAAVFLLCQRKAEII